MLAQYLIYTLLEATYNTLYELLNLTAKSDLCLIGKVMYLNRTESLDVLCMYVVSYQPTFHNKNRQPTTSQNPFSAYLYFK